MKSHGSQNAHIIADKRELSTSAHLIPWFWIVRVFLASRALYLIIIWIIPALTVGHDVYGGGKGFHQPWGQWLLQSLYNADSGFYWTIATHGYDHARFNTEHLYNWAFFPLYSWITRWVAIPLGPHAIIPVGIILSNAFFFMALVVLYRWMSRYTSPKNSRFGVLLAAFNPMTPYFAAYRAASLFFLLVVATLDAIDRRAWGWALVWGALASLTKNTGILLAIPYAIALWTRPWTATLWRRWAWFVSGIGFGVGFVVVGLIDAHVAGTPVAFLKIQAAWGRESAFPFYETLHWMRHPVNALTASGGWSLPIWAIFLSVITGLLALWMLRERIWWPAAWYMGLTVILANSYNMFEGIPRFIAELPPWYLGLTLWQHQAHKRELVLMVTIASMVLYCVLWVLGVHAVQN
ncbi:MAG: hypothetical protein C7B44_04540 [Sulfobacillus thermosulfidooxidans]|nr:MAG: hypothetical protein C7B44_04540 [Sulfobacillus thermosulfidooxidans]